MLVLARAVRRTVYGQFRLRPKNKPGLFDAKHFVRVSALDANTDARVRDLNLLGGRRRHFMRYHRVPMSQCVCDKVKVGDLQECADRRRLVVLAGGPSAHRCQRWQDRRIGFQKESVAPSGCPSCEFICAGLNFITDRFSAKNQFLRVGLDQPVPERRTEIQTVMQVLGLNEDVGVQQAAASWQDFDATPQLVKGVGPGDT